MLTEADVRVGGEEQATQKPEVSEEKGGLTPELAESTSINNPEDIHEFTGEITPKELQDAYAFLQNPDVELYAKYLHSTLGKGESDDPQRYISDARRGLGEMKFAWDRYIPEVTRQKMLLPEQLWVVLRV